MESRFSSFNGTTVTRMYNGTFDGNWSNQRNECRPIAEVFPEVVDYLYVRLLFGVLYLTVWVPGIAGNILVLYVATFKNISFTVRTVFITSLALSDLIIGLSSLPFTAITIFSRVWPFTAPMCHIINFVQAASTFVSSFTLTAIAVDRYFLIVKPHTQILTYKRSLACAVAAWVFGYLWSLPLGLFAELISYEEEYGTCGVFCEEAWPPQWRRIYGFLVMVLQFGLPLCLSCLCYTAISRTLGDQIQQRKKQTILPEAERRLINRRKRTNRMMTAMVALFALAWLPLNFLNFLRDFDIAKLIIDEDSFNLVFAVCHMASMTSIVWNPTIYSWFNEPFRTAIKQLLGASLIGQQWSSFYKQCPENCGRCCSPSFSKRRKSKKFRQNSTEIIYDVCPLGESSVV